MSQLRSGIFLAHSSGDKQFVRRLASDLLGKGIRIWLDEAEMRVGDSLIDRIGNGIKEMEYLGVVLSPKSVSSPWVKRELEIAISEEISSNKTKVLPIIFKKCTIPHFLSGRLWVDFSSKGSYKRALEILLKRFDLNSLSAINFLGAWPPEAVRLGVVSKLLITEEGKIELSPLFLNAFSEKARDWATGKLRANLMGEVVIHAVASAISGSTITEGDVEYIREHFRLHAAEWVVKLGVETGNITTDGDGLSIKQEVIDEIIEMMGTFGVRLIGKSVNEIDRFTLEKVIQAVRARVVLHGQNAMFSYPLGMLVFKQFKESHAYQSYIKIVSVK
jgi:hypothetical protein